MHRLRHTIALAVATLLAACGGAPTSGPPDPIPPATRPAQTPTSAQIVTSTVASTAVGIAAGVVDFPGADTVGLAAGSDGALYAVLGDGTALHVARSSDGGQSFAEPVLASGSTQAMINRFERPTIASGPGGALALSWLEQQGQRTLLWMARSSDGGQSFATPQQLTDTSDFETTMARLVAGADPPVVTWLQANSLRIARPDGDDFALDVVDELVCECCQPAALADGDRLALAYRNVERDPAGGLDTRDIFVAVSADGGASFAEPVRVSDAHWKISACPIAGPALAANGDQLYVAWMDGRADSEHTGLRADIFLAASADGGASFGPNVRVNPAAAGFHTLPALGIDQAGRLHIAWEAQDDAGAYLYYSHSADGGASFAPPRSLADNAGPGGRPGSPAIAIGPAGSVHIAWIDQAGAHVQTLAAGGS